MPVVEREQMPGHGRGQNVRGRGGVRIAERIKVPIPVFAADHVGFDAYMKEVKHRGDCVDFPKQTRV